jgi:hypothetical protein
MVDVFEPVKGFESYKVNRAGIIINKHGRQLTSKNIENDSVAVLAPIRIGTYVAAKSSDYRRLLVKNIVAKQFADWYEEGVLIRHIDGNK